MAVVLSNKEKHLYELLATIPPRLKEAEIFIREEKFGSMSLSRVANLFAENCMFDVDDYEEKNSISVPDRVTGDLCSAYIYDVMELLLLCGMSPNDILEGDVESYNIMHQLRYISNEYLAADALALLLEHGGDPDLMLDDDTLFGEADFAVFFDAVEQQSRRRLSSIVHFWMVLIGYRGSYPVSGNNVQLFREHGSNQLFDVRKLRNHRNYGFVICHWENDFGIIIYDKSTMWELARFR